MIGWVKRTSIAARLIAGLAVALLIAGLALKIQWQSSAGARRQARVETGQAAAARASTEAAITTHSETIVRERSIETITRRNEEEIRNAQGADDPVAPAVRDAWLLSLCRRKSTANDPACRLRDLDPAALEARRGERADPSGD